MHEWTLLDYLGLLCVLLVVSCKPVFFIFLLLLSRGKKVGSVTSFIVMFPRILVPVVPLAEEMIALYLILMIFMIGGMRFSGIIFISSIKSWW